VTVRGAADVEAKRVARMDVRVAERRRDMVGGVGVVAVAVAVTGDEDAVEMDCPGCCLRWIVFGLNRACKYFSHDGQHFHRVARGAGWAARVSMAYRRLPHHRQRLAPTPCSAHSCVGRRGKVRFSPLGVVRGPWSFSTS
jgi:hypothetical protein